MSIIKKLSILYFLLLPSSTLYAHGGFPIEVIIIYGGGIFLVIILISLLLAFVLPKLSKRKPKGIFRNLFTRTSLIFLIILIIPFINILFKSYIYNPDFISIKTLKTITIPIQNAFISFCHKNDRFPNGTREIDLILNPIGVKRKISKYTYNGVTLAIASGNNMNMNNRFNFHYYLDISTNINTSYHMYFNKDCSLNKDKEYKGTYVGILN